MIRAANRRQRPLFTVGVVVGPFEDFAQKLLMRMEVSRRDSDSILTPSLLVPYDIETGVFHFFFQIR